WRCAAWTYRRPWADYNEGVLRETQSRSESRIFRPNSRFPARLVNCTVYHGLTGAFHVQGRPQDPQGQDRYPQLRQYASAQGRVDVRRRRQEGRGETRRQEGRAGREKSRAEEGGMSLTESAREKPRRCAGFFVRECDAKPYFTWIVIFFDTIGGSNCMCAASARSSCSV